EPNGSIRRRGSADHPRGPNAAKFVANGGMPVMKNARQRIAREAVKLVLRPLLRWGRLDHCHPGFSIVIAVPWHLRHLLPVNLLFLSRTTLEGLDRIHVVFDRPQRSGMQDAIDAARSRVGAGLPLEFHAHRMVSGRLLECVNSAAFYHAASCVTGLGACR